MSAGEIVAHKLVMMTAHSTHTSLNQVLFNFNYSLLSTQVWQAFAM